MSPFTLKLAGRSQASGTVPVRRLLLQQQQLEKHGYKERTPSRASKAKSKRRPTMRGWRCRRISWSRGLPEALMTLVLASPAELAEVPSC